MILAFGLAACVTPADQTTPAPSAAAEAPPVETAALPTPRPQPVAPPSATAPSLPPPPPPAWTPPVPGPKHLVGLESSRVNVLLGPPDFRRTDSPAEVWQYRSKACVLDLFLYGGPKSGKKGGAAYRVTHAELRHVGPAAVSAGDCFRRLFKNRPRTAG